MLQVNASRSGQTVEESAKQILMNALVEIDEGVPREDQISFGGNEAMTGLGGKRFTDQGARAYTNAARYEFQKHAAIKGLDIEHALEELPDIAMKYQGDLELIRHILVGKHVLTGNEMVMAIKQTGNCPMMKTLQEWSGDPLPALSKVLVEAIEV